MHTSWDGANSDDTHLDQMKVLKRFPAFWKLIPHNAFYGSNFIGLKVEEKYLYANKTRPNASVCI